MSLAKHGANPRELASVEVIRWNPFEGQTQERVGCKNMQYLCALQDGYQVATELSHRELRRVCPSILARGVLTPLTRSESHCHSEGLSRFPLLGRKRAHSCSRAETRMRIALGSSQPRIDANRHCRAGRGALPLGNEKHELTDLLYSRLTILAVVIPCCGN